MKVISVNPSKCTACKLCELACSMKHSGAYSPALSRIHAIVFMDEAFYTPITCLQCDEAPCERACPNGSIRRNESTGVVELDEERCFGCKMCMLACPFGVMNFNEPAGYAMKCNNCDGEPECVLYCAPGALEYREVTSSVDFKKKSFAEKIRQAYGEV